MVLTIRGIMQAVVAQRWQTHSRALVPFVFVLLTSCTSGPGWQQDGYTQTASASMTEAIELSSRGETVSVRNRAVLEQTDNPAPEPFWLSLRNLFDGKGDPTLPSGTRSSAVHLWRDDGHGSAPSHWRPISFRDLPGWRQDAHSEALFAFLRSCDTINAKSATASMGDMSYGGSVRQWQQLCQTAASTRQTNRAARQFFEKNFQPYFVPGPGKFTGYYEASLNGSLVRGGPYQWPLYRKPDDLRVGIPYFDRAQIDAGVLAGQGLELLWVDNPVDVFFLQIQGSGLVSLPNGDTLRVGYAANNGHDFKGILPALEARGYDRDVNGLSIQDYQDWLFANPQVARSIMNFNPRYIFFDVNTAQTARGDGGTLLTPQRSMAVDKSIIPLHVPLWLTTNVPGSGGHGQVDVARLMLAQDTGTAIKGEIRGDYFWGHGGEAFARAGRMWGEGTYRVLLPNFIPVR